MELKPYICKCCGGRINVTAMRCEYCGAEYHDPSLRRLTIQTVQPGVHTIAAQVELRIPNEVFDPEGARDYALHELRNQLADGLLGYMKIRTNERLDPRYFERTEIIRGEVRVVDPMFDDRW